ncbi:membrane protein [Intrasporangium oryzae NRRL B-24470]|uniref:TVP38/TMEM64 family membrane protein n=1 Tax=Intrasporangium oryzae NRRL B-24470 TaxID=1386089 RepID=W9G341_9MICO|nr:VTT domain-containing protein [Intrasporangium oryzae]EWT00501.1 membrane protein [Intrasporangium oryzae NRRL B-24470]
MPPEDAQGHPVRVAALGVVLGAGAVVLGALGTADVDRVRAAVIAAGAAAPVLYVVATALLTLLPVPRSALSAVAGALFGLGTGVALAWTASLLGALAGYAVGRLVDPAALAWVTRRHHARARDLLDRRGVATVVWSRVLPVLPFTVVNYLAGLAGVRARAYAVGTAVGTVPGTVVYVAGGALAGGTLDLEHPAYVLTAGAAALAVAAVPLLRLRRGAVAAAPSTSSTPT